MNKRSLARLEKVDPRLKRLFLEAEKNSPVAFEIGETLRGLARQKELKAAGASWTLDSRHLPHPVTGFAMAADVYCLVGGKVRWDWPLYVKLAAHIKQVALQLGIALVWGGDWKKLRDGPHFELSRQTYP